MPTSPNAKGVEEARALYEAGATEATIAAALGVPADTVRQWARQDAAAGRPWTRGTDPRPAAPIELPPSGAPRPRSTGKRRDLADRLCRRLERRLEHLTRSCGKKTDDSPDVDEMLKVCKVLEFLRAGRDDPAAELRAMNRFALLCLRELSEEEMAPVRKAISLFVEELRKQSE